MRDNTRYIDSIDEKPSKEWSEENDEFNDRRACIKRFVMIGGLY